MNDINEPSIETLKSQTAFPNVPKLPFNNIYFLYKLAAENCRENIVLWSELYELEDNDKNQVKPDKKN